MSKAHIKFHCPRCHEEVDIVLDVGYDLANYPLAAGAFEKEDWIFDPYEMSKALSRMMTILAGAEVDSRGLAPIKFEVEPVTEAEKKARGIE